MDKFINWEEFKEALEANGKLTIRPSGVEQFIRCPAQWFRVHVLKDYQKPSAVAGLGTSLHRGAEVGYLEKIKTGKLPPLSVLQDAAVETWKECNKNPDLDYDAGDDYDNLESQLLESLSKYYSVVMPKTTPENVEMRYTIAIDSDIVDCVSGSIDIDTPTGIADIKMTKKRLAPEKYTLQQSIYSVLKEANGKKADYVEIHNVIRKGDVEVKNLPIKKDYAKFWVNSIIDTLEEFDRTKNPRLFRGSSPVSNFLCSDKWCGYWKICPFVKGL